MTDDKLTAHAHALVQEILDKVDKSEAVGNRPQILMMVTVNLVHLLMSVAPPTHLEDVLNNLLAAIKEGVASRGDSSRVDLEMVKEPLPERVVN